MMNPHTEQSPPPVALLTADDVAKLLSCSPRSLRRLADQGSVPRPVKVGGLVRWRRAAIDEWLDEGCPTLARRRRGR